MTMQMSLAERLRTLRQGTGCTQAEIATAAGIALAELERLERDGQVFIGNGTAARLARVYGVSCDELLAGLELI